MSNRISKTVVVGHGPSIRDSGYGRFIDSFKYVVRIPRLIEWRFEHADDFGKRVSCFGGSTACYNRYHDQLDKPEVGYLWWRNKKGSRLDRKANTLVKSGWSLDLTDMILCWQDCLEVVGNYKKKFSNGMGSIIASMVFGLPIVAVGCDNLKAGSNDNYSGSDYFEPTIAKNKKYALNKHDFRQEREIVNLASEHYDVPVRFL